MKPTMPLVAAALLLAGARPAVAREAATLTVTSAAFADQGAIPARYTCAGKSTPPPLQWTAAPPDSRSLAILVDDPDAPGGTFSHFVAFNLPPDLRSLADGTPPAGAHAVVARNSGGSGGFAPICPPSGRHHYRFVVLALDSTLALPASAAAADVERAAHGHILARGELVGLYQKTP